MPTEVDVRIVLHTHRGLVNKLVRQVRAHARCRADREEMIAWANAGLIEAATRYDPSTGASFATFAYYRVRGALYDGLRKMTELSPPRQRPSRQLVRCSQPSHGTGARPVMVSISCAVARQRPVCGRVYADGSSDPERAEEWPWSEHQLRTDDMDSATRVLMHKRVLTAVAALPARERHFIVKCYFHGKTILEAGQELGLSRSWSSRLHTRAIELLRAELEPRQDHASKPESPGVRP